MTHNDLYTRPTVVLTHGFQPKDQTLLLDNLWLGPEADQLGHDEHRGKATPLIASVNPNVNIVRYTWEDAFQVESILDRFEYYRARGAGVDEGVNVKNAGADLASKLICLLGVDYEQPIHFIGHSLGTVVNAYAAHHFLKHASQVIRAQFTALDRPHHVNKIPLITVKEIPVLTSDACRDAANESESDIDPEVREDICSDDFETLYGFNSTFFAELLHDIRPSGELDLRIDNYAADLGGSFITTSAGVGDAAHGPLDIYNHDVLNDPNNVGDFFFENEAEFIGIDNDHSGVQQWYRWTIDPNNKVFVERNDQSMDFCDRVTYEFSGQITPPFNPFGTQFIDSSLNPCQSGWHWALNGRKPDDFPTDNGNDVDVESRNPDMGVVKTTHGCEILGKIITCKASSLDTSLATDTSLLQVTLTEPADGSSVKDTITVTAEVSDNVLVERVEFWLESDTVEPQSVPDYSSPYSAPWNTTLYPNGSYRLTAKVYDVVGNVKDSPSITATVNNPANTVPNTPASLAQYQSDGSTLLDWSKTIDVGTVVMKAVVSDPDGDTVRLEVEVQPVGTAFENSPSSNCTSGLSVASGGTASVTCSGLSDGSYRWQARAKDSDGFVSAWASAGGNAESEADFIVSTSDPPNPPPTVTLVSPNGGETLVAGSTHVITWVASDPEGQALSVILQYSLDGGATWVGIPAPATFLPDTGEYQWTLPATPSSTAMVAVTVFDPSLLLGIDLSNKAFSIIESVGGGSGDGDTGTVPSCITPSAPGLNDPGISSTTGNFSISWSNINTATSYTLQESTSSSFSTVTEYTPSGPSQSISGKANGFYVYRVKAVNDCDSSGWSNVVDMKVRINQPPTIPSNPSPKDQATNVSRNPLLSWTGGDPDGTVEYGLKLDTNPNPGFFVAFGQITGTSYQVTSTLSPGTTYYWGVVARDDQGGETQGPIWSFTTEYTVPDLVPTHLDVTGTIEPDAEVTLTLTVKNQGGETAFNPCQVRFYYSAVSGKQEQAFQLAGDIRTPELAPGAQATLTATVTLTNLRNGESFIDAWIDTQTCSSDFTPDNNLISAPIQYQDGTAPVIEFLSLAEGFTFYKTADTYSIIIEASDDVGVVTLDFYASSEGGATWTVIETGVPAPASIDVGATYSWTIPADFPLTENLMIKLVVWDASGNSDEEIAGPYIVKDGTAPTVTVISPNGGEVWDMGSTQEIKWELSAPNGVRDLKLYFHYPLTIDIISDNISSNTSGSFLWQLPPNLSTKEGKIRIYLEDENGNENEDWSDGFFEIKDTSAGPPPPWTEPVVIADESPVSNPQIAVDSSGSVHMVYEGPTVLYKKREGATWSDPITVFSVAQEADFSAISELQIAVDSQGLPHVVWQTDHFGDITQLNNNDIFYTSYDGASWSDPINLSESLTGGTESTTVQWTPKASMPVETRGAASAVVNGKLYVIGAPLMKDLFEYDPASDSWSKKADLPGNGISEGGAAVIDGKIYAVGDLFDHNVKIYDPSTDTWSTGATIPTTGRRGMSVAAVGGKLYAIGGWTSGGLPLATNEMYDPTTDQWAERADIPVGRGFAGTAVIDNKIYVIGGRSGSDCVGPLCDGTGDGGCSGSLCNMVEVYDPATDRWETRKAMPTFRSSLIAAAVNNKIYAIGGFDGHQVMNAVEEYDPSTNTWVSKTSMPTARSGMAGGVIGSNIYVAGGTDNVKSLSTNEQATVTGGLSGTDSRSPRIAVDASDRVQVVWRDGTSWNPDVTINGQGDIYHRVNDPVNGWSAIAQLTATGGTEQPAIATDHMGNVHVIYSRNGLPAYIKWDGAAWTDPDDPPPASTAIFSRHLDLVADQNGGLHLLGSFGDANGVWSILYSVHDGVSWSLPEEVVGQRNKPPDSLSIAVDSLSRPHIIWDEFPSSSPTRKLFYTKRDANGWSQAIQLHLDSQSPFDSDLVLSPIDDEAHVVWVGLEEADSKVFYNHANVTSVVADDVPPTVTVLSPVGGEVLHAGSLFNIQWSASDDVGVHAIKIEYITGGDDTSTTIVSNQANDGIYQWTVPNISSDTAHIQITASDAAGNEGLGISERFSITDQVLPSVTLISPNGGETWEAGSRQTILWETSGVVDIASIALQYSIDGGVTWLPPIVENELDSGAYQWTIPDLSSSNVLLNVVAKDINGNPSEDRSDRPFSIVRVNQPPLAPHSPFPPSEGTNVSLTPALEWTANDLDGDSLTYDVYFGTESNPPLVSPKQTGPMWTTGSLSSDTVYFWKVVASDGKSETESLVWTFTTGSEFQNPPGGFTGIAVASDQIQLSWMSDPANTSGFEIERKEAVNDTYVIIAALASNISSYIDTGLRSHTTYFYRIRAIDGALYSQELLVTTPNSAPNSPTNPLPADRAVGQPLDVTVAWSGGDPDSRDSVAYDVYFGTTTNPPLVSSDQPSTVYVPRALAPNEIYFWQILAKDGAGDSAMGPLWFFITGSSEAGSASILPTPEPIHAPNYLKAALLPDRSIALSWIDNSVNEEMFVLEWRIGTAGDFTHRADIDPNRITWIDTGDEDGFEVGITYCYRVKASAAGLEESGYSNEACVAP